MKYRTIIFLTSVLLVLLTGCSLPTMRQIDTTEDYRALGYPDQRKIARDSQGRLFVAYRKKYRDGGTTTYRIFVARSSDGGASWQILNDERPIEAVGPYNQRVPTIAIDGRDVIHVAWYGQDAQNSGENQRQIKYARSTDGGANWTPWVNVGVVQGYDGQRLWQEHPTLAVSGSNVYIVWQGLDPDNPKAAQVRLAHSPDSGATWDPWRTVQPTGRGNRSRPAIVAAPDGKTLTVLAYGGVGTPQQIVWTTSVDGGATWADWRVVAPSAGDQRHISLALDNTGRLHALWRQMTDAGGAEIVYAVLNGSTWSAPVAVQPGAQNQFFPSIAVAGDNSVWATWTASDETGGLPEDDPQRGTVVVAKKIPDGSWQTLKPPQEQRATTIYSSLRWGEHPNGGTVDLVWLQQAGENWQVMFSALDEWQ